MEGDSLNQHENPVQNPAPQVVKPAESSMGPIIGTVIILAVIILGGLYFWGERTRNMNPSGNEAASVTATTSATSDAELNALRTQSNANDTASIEADLQNTDIDNLDASLR